MKSQRKKQINLKKYIINLSSDELKQELMDLINRFPQVREYYHIRINPTEYQEILNEYKKRIKLEFFPEKGYGDGRPSVGKAPILQFLKVSSAPENLIDLMLYYVEQGIKYTLAYGDIDEPFYNSLESVYEDSLDLIKENNLYEQFYFRCKKAVDDTEDIGWGFHDYLKYLFKKYFK